LQTGEALGAAELEDEELEDEAATLEDAELEDEAATLEDDEPEDEAAEDDEVADTDALDDEAADEEDADEDTDDDEMGAPQFLSKKVETGRPGRMVKPVEAVTSYKEQSTKVIAKLTHLGSF
jgi:hypothetical protein